MVAHNCHGQTKFTHGKTKVTYGKTKFSYSKMKLTHGKIKFTHGETKFNYSNTDKTNWSAVPVSESVSGFNGITKSTSCIDLAISAAIRRSDAKITALIDTNLNCLPVK